MTQSSLKILSLLVLGVASAGATAGNSIEDTHIFRLGAYRQEADLNARSSVAQLPALEINFGDELGLDDKNTAPFINYRWRFGEKWSTNLVYQRLELTGSATTVRDFNFDGEEFTAGVAVDSEFNVNTYLIDLTYSFIRNDRWELSAGVGVHAFDFETAIAGQAGIRNDEDEAVTDFATASASVLAPLPNLRGSATYLITPRWEVRGNIGWLSLKIDDIDGAYLFASIATEYRVTDRFGIGASYQIANMDVTEDTGTASTNIDLNLEGPSVYITFGF